MVNLIQDELGCAMHDLFNEKCTQRPKAATPPQNLTSVNWMDLLDPTSRIPADVSFKIIERSNNNEGEEKVMGEVCNLFFCERIIFVYGHENMYICCSRSD